MTNRAALFPRSIQCFSSTVMVMMLSVNPYIDSYVAMMSTSRGSTFAIWIVKCCLSSCGSKDMCGEFISSMLQNSSWGRLFPRSIAASLTVVYSDGTGVVPNGDRRHRKASSYTISMQVEAVVAFARIRR